MNVVPSRYLATLSQLVLFLAPAVYLARGQQGQWGPWSEVSACSVTCGSGTQKKVRQWISAPGQPTQDKPFTNSQMFTCSSSQYRECPSDGVWSEWYAASACTKMCGTGTQRRRRDCLGQAWGGQQCDGESEENAKCNEVPCPRLPPNFDMSQCKIETNYTCTSGKMCVPGIQRCDGELNCHDGSDEFNCTRKYGPSKSVGDSGSLLGISQYVIWAALSAIVVLLLN